MDLHFSFIKWTLENKSGNLCMYRKFWQIFGPILGNFWANFRPFLVILFNLKFEFSIELKL